MYGRGNERGEGRERFEDMGPKPVKVGDELDVTIEAQAARGDGLAKKDGFVIFVAGAKVGQTIRVRITDVKQRYAVGQMSGEAGAAPVEESAPAPGPEAAADEGGADADDAPPQ